MRSRTLLHSGLPMTASLTKSCPSCGERYDADVLFCPQDGTPLTNVRGAAHPSTEIDLYVGLELAGHIRIKHLIGIGSMGRVYRAFQGGIERDVAVKVLHRELCGNAELVARFHREAKIASRLSHPNVVSVLMTGSIAQKGDARLGGEMYLVMEYLDGMSLLSALAAAGTGGVPSALPLSRALHIMIQVCEAVGEAHAHNIVHRDIKPENVMLVRRGDDPDFVKVLDFGIARLDWADGSMATQAGLVFGTARYISPEGAEGKPVTPAADVYSIATVLYQCLAGQTPFEADSPVQLLMHHAHTPAPNLRGIPRASYVPEPIAAVIMRNLAKKPQDRAQDARAFGKDLVAAIRESGLDPDEVFRGETLGARQGATKLPSKERTKSLGLSPELAARIGGIAARAAETTSEPEAPSTTESNAADAVAEPDTSNDPSSAKTNTSEAKPSSAPSEDEVRPKQTDAVVRPSKPTPSVETKKNSERPPSPVTVHRSIESPQIPTRGRIKQTALMRVAIVVLGILSVPFVVLVMGKQLGWIATTDLSLDGRLEAAREAMRQQAWDSPPNENVKDILDQAQRKWPDDVRVRDLRREAAERLVTNALGRKYEGASSEALRLARLAVSLQPSLTAAKRLVAELEGAAGPETSATVPSKPQPSGGP